MTDEECAFLEDVKGNWFHCKVIKADRFEDLLNLIDKLRAEKEEIVQLLRDLAFNYEPCLSCNRMEHAQETLERLGRK